MDYWYILVCNTEFFYLTWLRIGLVIHSRLQHRVLLPHLPTSSTIDTFSSATPSILLYLPTSRTIVTWHRLKHRVFYLTCLYYIPLLHGIDGNTECSTVYVYLTNHCYMASSATPSVLLHLPTSRTIVTWHRLKHRLFYLTCLYHRPLLHGIDRNTECSTLSAYITDHCYMASSATPSVLPYLPISRTIVTWHRL